MKLKLFFIAVILVMSFTAFRFYSQMVHYKAERDRINNNYEQTVSGLNRTITLTQRELRSYLKENVELDSLLRAERLKPSKIEYITRVKYKYIRDTVWVNVGEWNNDKTYFTFNYADKCLSFGGGVDIVTPSVHLSNIELKNEANYVGYLKRKDTGRRFLWVFPIKKDFLELHVSDNCGTSEVHQINVIN